MACMHKIGTCLCINYMSVYYLYNRYYDVFLTCMLIHLCWFACVFTTCVFTTCVYYMCIYYMCVYYICFWVRVMVFNATFNNISVISWWSVLLVEETGVHGENHRPSSKVTDVNYMFVNTFVC